MNRLETLSPDQTWEALALPTSVLVTVNRRLARYLKHQYDARQIKDGRRIWETPPILPYTAWLETCFDDAALSLIAATPAGQPLLLSAERERRVWEQVISEWSRAQGMALLQAAETARPAMEARELCREWRISRQDLKHVPSDETAAFLQWSAQVEAICRENNWMDRAGLADAVMDQMRQGAVPMPQTLVLAGFDELSPRQREMVKLLQDHGSRVRALSEPPGPPAGHRRCAFPDREAEMAAAARWVRDCLAEHTPDAGSPLRLAIVAPDLENRRTALMRHLDDALQPSRVLAPDDSGPRPYNISLGRPLSRFPMVQAALRLLSLAHRPLEVAEYGAFLQSPYLAGAETERSSRAFLDASLRKAPEMQVTLPVLTRYAENRGEDARFGAPCPILNSRLRALHQKCLALPKSGPPSLWASEFQAMLEVMGWPGERALNSDEYQALGAWQEALARFSGLDLVSGATHFPDALDLLARLLSETLFQPESGDAPVQVLGILESAGERFTHLWVMGLDDDTWPPPARPNPFLPAAIQRHRGLPHGSAKREAEFAHRILSRLLGAAPNIIFSHPLWDGDTALSPSPMISGIPEITAAPPGPGWRERACRSALMSLIDDHTGPEVAPGSHLSGGTGLLKAQAVCPFSAFATYRLGARPLETPEPGLDARERGRLVHHALESVWETLRTQAALNALSQAALQEMANNIAGLAVAESARRHPRIFTPIFTRVETDRLAALLLAWLEMEKIRPPFTVSGHEKQLAVTVAGIHLSTVADRIDRLADERLVIVDYKTGEPKPADWFADRIREPQLPLYTLTADAPVAGVVFGQVKKGKVKYLGVVEETAAWEGVWVPSRVSDPDGKGFGSLADILDFWQKQLNTLAQEARQGIAAVAPVDASACRYCDLGILCRIAETGMPEDLPLEDAP